MLRFSIWRSPGYGGRGLDLRSILPLLLAVVGGLLVAFLAGRFYLQYVNTHREVVHVVVPARDIPPYTVISEADLTNTVLPAGGEDHAAARDASEVVGRLALYPLYRGEQIRRERLVDPSVVKDRQVVSVSVDVARCVGGSLQPGSLVDVWWVNDPAVPGTWQLAAADAVVLDIRDSSGRSVIQQQASLAQQVVSGGASQGPSSPPAVAVLAVRNTDVVKVVGGASMKSQNIVLAKKYTEGGAESYAAGAVQPQPAGTQPQPGTGAAPVQPGTAARPAGTGR